MTASPRSSFRILPSYERGTFSLAEATLQTTSSSSSISIDAESRLVVIHVEHDEIASRVYNRQRERTSATQSRVYTHSRSCNTLLIDCQCNPNTRFAPTRRVSFVYTYVYPPSIDAARQPRPRLTAPTLPCGSTWIYENPALALSSVTGVSTEMHRRDSGIASHDSARMTAHVRDVHVIDDLAIW